MQHAPLLLILIVSLAACDSGGSESAAPTAPVPTTPSPPPAAPVAAPTPTALPRAEDVLPAGEVSAGALAVMNEGYRFQIRPSLTEEADLPDTRAFRGRLDGMLGPIDVKLLVSREPYSGDLASLVEQQREINVTAQVTEDMVVTVMRAGQVTLPAHRFVFSGTSSVRMLLLAVDGGYSYWFRCELPPEPNAWINAGVDCMTMGATLHIAPP
jgi:hypothetical protein